MRWGPLVAVILVAGCSGGNERQRLIDQCRFDAFKRYEHDANEPTDTQVYMLECMQAHGYVLGKDKAGDDKWNAAKCPLSTGYWANPSCYVPE